MDEKLLTNRTNGWIPLWLPYNLPPGRGNDFYDIPTVVPIQLSHVDGTFYVRYMYQSEREPFLHRRPFIEGHGKTLEEALENVRFKIAETVHDWSIKGTTESEAPRYRELCYIIEQKVPD